MLERIEKGVILQNLGIFVWILQFWRIISSWPTCICNLQHISITTFSFIRKKKKRSCKVRKYEIIFVQPTCTNKYIFFCDFNFNFLFLTIQKTRNITKFIYKKYYYLLQPTYNHLQFPRFQLLLSPPLNKYTGEVKVGESGWKKGERKKIGHHIYLWFLWPIIFSSGGDNNVIKMSPQPDKRRERSPFPEMEENSIPLSPRLLFLGHFLKNESKESSLKIRFHFHHGEIYLYFAKNDSIRKEIEGSVSPISDQV